MSQSYDQRTISRYIKSGQVTKEEYDKHLAGLSDDKDNFEWIAYDAEEADLASLELEHLKDQENE